MTMQNVVIMLQLTAPVCLKRCAARLPNIEYNPRRFSAAIMRQRQPWPTTALLFSTGKLVCTGARTVEAGKQAARHFARQIQRKVHAECNVLSMRVVNLVASCALEYRLNLPGKFTL